MKKSIIVNNKEYSMNDIEAGVYEEYCEAKEKVNPDEEYSAADIRNMREAIAIAYGNEFTADDLKKMPVTDVMVEFVCLDAWVAKEFERKFEKAQQLFTGGK